MRENIWVSFPDSVTFQLLGSFFQGGEGPSAQGKPYPESSQETHPDNQVKDEDRNIKSRRDTQGFISFKEWSFSLWRKNKMDSVIQ